MRATVHRLFAGRFHVLLLVGCLSVWALPVSGALHDEAMDGDLCQHGSEAGVLGGYSDMARHRQFTTTT